jgi:AmpD protein
MTSPPDCAGTALWQAGWYRFARKLASPNFGARPAGALVDLIVVHSISLPPGRYGGDEVQRLFSNTLDWDAHVFPLKASGPAHSISGAMANSGSSSAVTSVPGTPGFALPGRDCNDDSIGIEPRVWAAPSKRPRRGCRGCAPPSPSATRSSIAGHEHIAPGKGDRRAFQWSGLRRSLASAGARFLPENSAARRPPTEWSPHRGDMHLVVL